MNRREFFSTTAAGVAALATTRLGWAAQAVDPKVDWKKVRQSTLDRIAIMTLNFQSILKVPDTQDSPNRTLELFDIGEMLADTYGVHKVEFQHYHLASVEPSYFRDLRAKLEKNQVPRHADQPGVQRPEHLRAAEPRPAAGDRSHEDVDRSRGHARRAARNDQPGPADARRTRSTASRRSRRWPTTASRRTSSSRWKRAAAVGADAGAGGRVDRVRARREPRPPARRGHAARDRAAAGAPPAAGTGAAAAPQGRRCRGGPGRARPAPPPSGPDAWPLLAEIIKGAGAYSNVDLGGANAPNQEELHRCLKMMFPMTANSLHTRVNTRWDLATAMRYLEGELGYKGLYTIEAGNSHEGTRQIYDVVVATLDAKT